MLKWDDFSLSLSLSLSNLEWRQSRKDMLLSLMMMLLIIMMKMIDAAAASSTRMQLLMLKDSSLIRADQLQSWVAVANLFLSRV